MLNGKGLVKSSWSQYYGLYFEWSATQRVTNNDSEITFTVFADFVSYGTIQVGARNDGKMSIAGQEQTVSMPAVTKLNNGNARIKLATIKRRVKHRDDGTLPNVVLKAVWPIRATIAGVYRSTIEGTFSTGEIKRIPRASEIKSSADFTLENDLKVNLKRYSDDFKHDILLKINGSNFKTITNVDTSTTITFTETEINNLYNQSVNVSELSTELVVTTKQNTTTIGTTSKKGKMFIDPIKNAPIFEEFEFKPDNKTALATGWNNYITEDNNLSILGHTIYTIKPGTATGKNGATITGFEISLNNRVYHSTRAEFTLPNPIIYNDNLIVSAVDSRGFKTKVIKNIRGQQYTKIKFDKLDIKRRNYPNQSQVNFEVEGTIFKNDNVNNQLASRFRTREVGGNYGSWINLTSYFIVQSNGKFTASFNRSNFDSAKSYDIEFEISDIFYTEPFKIPINMEKAVVTITKNKLSIKKLTDYLTSDTPSAWSSLENGVYYGDVHTFIYFNKYISNNITYWSALYTSTLLGTSLNPIKILVKSGTNTNMTGFIYFITKEDLYYKPGDIFKFDNRTALTALVTSGTTRLYISVPVSKSLANINSIVCNSFQAEIRGINGYLNSQSGMNEYVNKAGYTITCEKGTDNIIRVILDKSTAWTNTSNNTPVIVMLNESSYFTFA